MIIYSWNILFENKKLEEAFIFIKNAEFDIFCLQEVPGSMLEKLEGLEYSLEKVKEIQLSTDSKTFSIYSVVLSKHPILKSQEIHFTDPLPPLRTKFTRFVLSFLRRERIIKWENRVSFFIDLEIATKPLRVFNLHLPLLTPMQRMKELQQAMQNKTDNMIICGDFNILETLYISLLNWLLGGSLADWFLYARERKAMEELFHSLGLINPFQGRVTHGLSRSQLDHILVSKSSEIKRLDIFDANGSDHNPIRIEIA